MESKEVPRKIWEHSDPKSTAMYKFMQEVNQKYGLRLETYHDLYDFSINQQSKFWDHCFHYLRLIYTGSYVKVVDESARMDTIPSWFEGVYINIAENLLYTRSEYDQSPKKSTQGKEDCKIAVTEIREGNTEIKDITWGQLRSEVAELASAMRAHGVTRGDRIAVVASNSFDTLKVFLATSALGCIFSSNSTDMGVKGILDRLVQIEPKYIFVDDWAVYNGKTIDLRQKMMEISNRMKTITVFAGLISMPRFREHADITMVPMAMTLHEYIKKATSKVLYIEATTFRDPFMIAYSSGTTGAPKCIVHSNGGALLCSAKENILHREMTAQSVVLQYTTTGWIMYFSSVMGLLTGSRIILYDGSPFQPDLTTFIKILGEQKVTVLGTSPRWMTELENHGIIPSQVTDLSNLRKVVSTGMVLNDRQFEWFYRTAFPRTVHLANISGGTDIAGCFGLENPLDPLYIGGTQGVSLGVKVEVYDSQIAGGRGVKGNEVPYGTPGELVATPAFPNMPVKFWNDVKGKRYFSAYFEKYDNVWTQGDFVIIHPKTRQLLFLGRADGVLNPSGIRFGSAEIYSVLESHFPQVKDSICVGQRRPQDNNETVMLFCLMQSDEKFTQKLVSSIKAMIRRELSPKHVPKYVFETHEIPTTVNLKKVELPVKQIVSGQVIQPSDTLLNPESLRYYYQFAKVEELVAPQPKL